MELVKKALTDVTLSFEKMSYRAVCLKRAMVQQSSLCLSQEKPHVLSFWPWHPGLGKEGENTLSKWLRTAWTPPRLLHSPLRRNVRHRGAGP